MRDRLGLVLALLASSTVMASVVWNRSASVRDYRPVVSPSDSLAPPESPVNPLNECIQKRFHDIENVGMARMPVIPHHLEYQHDRFNPVTTEEKAAVSKLGDDGWKVGFYLAGRAVLESDMTEAKWSEWEKTGPYRSRHSISQPLAITGEEGPGGLPQPWELWGDAQKALIALASSDFYTSSLGRWSIDARPVRAGRESCLECHRKTGAGWNARAGTGDDSLRIGDAVGVVLYVSSRVSK